MKKKILLVLLVVLMVGILAFSIFACNKPEEPKKPNKPQGEEPGVEPEDVDYFSPMISDVIGAIDNTAANLAKIEDAASVSASIYLDVAMGEDNYNVKLDIKGSIDDSAKAKNWAQIDADVLGVKVSLFAVNNGEVEDLYIAQNILNENTKWNKLSQFEEANVLSNLACNSILDLVKGIDEATKTQLEDGIIDSLAGGVLGMLPMISGFNLFVPSEGAAADFTTEDGFSADINVSAISELLGMEMVAGLLGGLPADFHGIISTAIDLLLGAELTFNQDGSVTFKAGTAEETPTISLGFGVEDNLFTGLALSYVLGDLDIQFGINNLSLSDESVAYKAPYTGTPEELAVALNLDVNLPGVNAETLSAVVNIYPNVAMSFDEDGYIDLDFTNLVAYATLNDTVIAEFNADNGAAGEAILLDMGAVVDGIFGDTAALYSSMIFGSDAEKVYRVPVNLTEKWDNFIANEKAPKEQVAANAAAEGNVVDEIITTVGGIIGGGDLDIGAILGIATELIDAVKAFESDITIADGAVTVNLESIMGKLLADDGLISTMTTDLGIQLYNETTGVKEDVELADLLAKNAVLQSIASFVNAASYENYVASLAEGDTAIGYVDYVAEGGLAVDDIIAVVERITGATLSANDAYDNMKIALAGYAQDGIGASISVTLGTTDAATTSSIGIGASIIENKAYTGTIAFTEASFAVEDGSTMSNDTGKDGGALLLNTVKKIANQLIYAVYSFDTVVPTALGSADWCPIEMVVGTTTTGDFENAWEYWYVFTAPAAGTLNIEVTSACGEVYALVMNPRMGREMEMEWSQVVQGGANTLTEGQELVIRIAGGINEEFEPSFAPVSLAVTFTSAA